MKTPRKKSKRISDKSRSKNSSRKNPSGIWDFFKKKPMVSDEERKILIKQRDEEIARFSNPFAEYVEKSEERFYRLLNKLKRSIDITHDLMLASKTPNEMKKYDRLVKSAEQVLIAVTNALIKELPKSAQDEIKKLDKQPLPNKQSVPFSVSAESLENEVRSNRP